MLYHNTNNPMDNMIRDMQEKALMHVAHTQDVCSDEDLMWVMYLAWELF